MLIGWRGGKLKGDEEGGKGCWVTGEITNCQVGARTEISRIFYRQLTTEGGLYAIMKFAKRHSGESQTTATNVTLHPHRQAIWGLISKRIGEKSPTDITNILPSTDNWGEALWYHEIRHLESFCQYATFVHWKFTNMSPIIPSYNELLVLLAPSGALYVAMCHYWSRPLAIFHSAQCHIS